MLLVLSIATSSMQWDTVYANQTGARNHSKQKYIDYIMNDFNSQEKLASGDNLHKTEEKAIEEYSEVLEVLDVDAMDAKEKTTEEFGGAYLDDNGHLVVLLNKENSNTKVIKEIQEIDQNIEVKEVENNLKELHDIKKLYDEKISQLCELKNNGTISGKEDDLFENILGCGISIEENSIIVEMQIVNDYYINLFKQMISNSEVFRFEKSNIENEVTATKINLGRAIYKFKSRKVTINGNTTYTQVNSMKSSVGLKAYIFDSSGNRINGFFTCGHGWEKGDDVYIDNMCETKVGRVIKRKLSGAVDASFVKVTNSKYVPSRVVYYSDAKGNKNNGNTIAKCYVGRDFALEGETVYKAGATTYLTKGKLSHVDYTANVHISSTDSYVTLKHLYRAKIKVDAGDSGGVCYQYYGDEYVAIGIVESKSGDYANFVNAGCIDESFDYYYY